jgi:hypothetical protein
VRALAAGSRYQPLATDLAVAVDLTGVEDLAAASADGTPVELLATIEALGDGPGGVAWEWGSFIDAIRLSMNSLA